MATECHSFSSSQIKHHGLLPRPSQKVTTGRIVKRSIVDSAHTKIKTRLNDGLHEHDIKTENDHVIVHGNNYNLTENRNNSVEYSGSHHSENQQQAIAEIEVPSMMTIVNFALPAIGIYLCSPLLSMIDTSTVGILCGTLQQAALHPAITIIDYASRTMSFLYTGTTNSIASSQGKTASELKEMFIGSLRLAAIVGIGLAIFLLLTSQRMIVPLVGNDSIDIEVLHAAWRYVAIRSIGMPAAAMIGTSQAACLGLKDNKTPFRIIVAAAAMNLVLDVALVGQKGIAWVGGTAGAAWATTISQYFALYLFLRRFTSNKEPEHAVSTNGESATAEGTSTTKGLLAGNLSWRNFFNLPCKRTWKEFRPFIIPVTTTQIGRCSTYVAMGHVVSSTMNAVSMAAQQIITSIFYALIPIGDSCGLTAQTFLPSILANKPSQRRTRALNKTMKNIFKVSSLLGIFLASIAASIPLMCPLLTQDPAVVAQVKQIVPIMLGLMSTHGVFCASEGMLLGFRDLKFLGNIYAVFFVAVPTLMLRLKYVARAGVTVSLRSIWDVFLGYQAFRITSFLCRALLLRRRASQLEPESE